MMLTGKARLAGVIGWPVAHSLSPKLHGTWLERYGIDGAYVPLAVDPSDLAAVVRSLPLMGFRGINVTLPHKAKIIDLCDQVDDGARRIGAVNTVIFDEQGMMGRNTDAFGFIENLKAAVPDFVYAGKTALVLGAGGAARAVVAALCDEGCTSFRIVNRTRDQAEDLIKDVLGGFGVQSTIVDWMDRSDAVAGAGVVINATALGMEGMEPLHIALDDLDPAALVTDIVYAPLQTDLLRAAQARGNSVVDGLGMLLHQARPGFEAWFGHRPVVDNDLRRRVLAKS
ncbi:MAG: shikimate dehydrogenase [Rhodospirillales bacterium]